MLKQIPRVPHSGFFVDCYPLWLFYARDFLPILDHMYTARISLVSVILICAQMITVAQKESDHVPIIAHHLGGVQEYRTSDGDWADLVTDTHAYEIELAPKWKESIGQALWYAIQTDRKAGIVLILRQDSDFKYLQKLQSTIDHNGLTDKMDVLVYPMDFPSATYLAPQDQRSNGHHENSLNGEGQYWLSTNSKKRHNASCRWYQKSKGRPCGPSEGKAAGCCGGR